MTQNVRNNNAILKIKQRKTGVLRAFENWINMMDKTLNYYNENAQSFASGTVSVEFTEMQDRFLEKLDPGAYILDFGCGAGRDTKYFLSQGYRVDAIDGSEQLCQIASDHTGIKVRQMLFQELEANEKYNGIWACASILHLPKKELKKVLKKMLTALKTDGWIYTSFKYGEYEGNRNGRYFTDFTIDTFTDFVQGIQNLRIEEHWITGDVRPGRGEEKWLNLILQKE